MAGEYTGQVMLDAIGAFLKEAAPDLLPAMVRAPNEDRPQIPDLTKTVPIRPPGFCTGCPERPIFAAMKLVQKETGKLQISADIGCHLFGALPPFEVGGATMGYGLGPAANAAFDGGGKVDDHLLGAGRHREDARGEVDAREEDEPEFRVGNRVEDEVVDPSFGFVGVRKAALDDELQ